MIPWALRWRIWCLGWKPFWHNDNDLAARLKGYKGYEQMVSKL